MYPNSDQIKKTNECTERYYIAQGAKSNKQKCLVNIDTT